MEILYHKNFLKNYRKRILPYARRDSQFKKKFKLFQENPHSSSLKDHSLIGKRQEYRSFSITGDIRVVYKKFGKTILLYDIGSHNQVY